MIGIIKMRAPVRQKALADRLGTLASPPAVRARLPEAKEMMTAAVVAPSWAVVATGNSPVTPA